MSGRPTIDLGLYHPGRDRVPDDPPWPPWSSLSSLALRALWWRRPAGTQRSLLAAAAAVLLVPVVGPATVPPGPPLVALWTVPDSASDEVQLAVGEHDVYASARTPEGWTLTSYRLADGALRWERLLGADGGWVRLAGGLPLVTSVQGLDDAVTIAFDPDTGLPRWQQRGTPGRAVADGRLLLHRALPDAEPTLDGERPYQLVAVDQLSGQLVWTARIEAGEQLLFGGDTERVGTDPAHLVSLRRDGRLTRYDLATGETVGVETHLTADQQRLVLLRENVPPELAGRLHWLVRGTYPLLHTQAGEGLVVLSYRGEGSREVVAYDADTLAPRWRAPDRSWAGLCQPVICLAAEAGAGQVDGVDPVTGAVEWSMGCTGADAPTGHCHLLPVGVAPGLVLIERWASSRPSGPFFGGAYLGTRIVDSRTGELVTDLGYWRLLAPGDGGSWLLNWPDTDPGGRTDPPRQVTLARLSVDPVRLDLLGSVGARHCEPSGVYLLCWSSERNEADVWQVR